MQKLSQKKNVSVAFYIHQNRKSNCQTLGLCMTILWWLESRIILLQHLKSYFSFLQVYRKCSEGVGDFLTCKLLQGWDSWLARFLFSEWSNLNRTATICVQKRNDCTAPQPAIPKTTWKFFRFSVYGPGITSFLWYMCTQRRGSWSACLFVVQFRYFPKLLMFFVFLQEPPQYMRDITVPPNVQTTTVRCYCLITKFPFFRLHFDFLFSLFG